VERDICLGAHRVAGCPLKRKCLRCRQEHHIACLFFYVTVSAHCVPKEGVMLYRFLDCACMVVS